jgi:hypothetical protein
MRVGDEMAGKAGVEIGRWVLERIARFVEI